MTFLKKMDDIVGCRYKTKINNKNMLMILVVSRHGTRIPVTLQRRKVSKIISDERNKRYLVSRINQAKTAFNKKGKGITFTWS